MIRDALALISRVREILADSRLTLAQREVAKLKSFRRLVLHAYAKSPYYAEMIAARGIEIESCAPADFPILTKQMLMENFDGIVTDRRVTRQAIEAFLARSRSAADKYLGRYRVMHTSGTSGEIGYVVYSLEDWRRGMVIPGRWRNLPRPGRRKGSRGKFRVAFFGVAGGHSAGATMSSACSEGLAGVFVTARAFDVNDRIARTVADLNAYQPELLTGYTMALCMLAAEQMAGRLAIAPMIIAATGETVSSADMNRLSAAFGGVAIGIYACTEHLAMGSSDPGGQTMTLNDEKLIFEFGDDHSLVTNLFNYTMPLIRYRMSDAMIPVPGFERRLVVQNVIGRTESMALFATGRGTSDFISGHAINQIRIAGVSRVQLRITGDATFRLRVLLEPGLNAVERQAGLAGARKSLQGILDRKGLDATFTVEAADELPVNPRTGKFELIVDARATG
jgi:phenylacetate-coenzyme A ligase PaaK-like adenylate-forming protein